MMMMILLYWGFCCSSDICWVLAAYLYLRARRKQRETAAASSSSSLTDQNREYGSLQTLDPETAATGGLLLLEGNPAAEPSPEIPIPSGEAQPWMIVTLKPSSDPWTKSLTIQL